MKNLTLLLLLLLSVSSCGKKFKAQRLSTQQGDEKAMDITDAWLATDTKMAVQDILMQIQKHNGYRRYRSQISGKRPKVFIAEVANNTSEPYFPIQDLNDELLNEFSFSGEYILIDSAARERILNEIQYQNDGMVKPEDVAKIGRQSGANLLIFGNINMIPYTRDGQTIKEYSVNIRMTDIQTGEEVLRTRYKTSKYSKRSGYAW